MQRVSNDARRTRRTSEAKDKGQETKDKGLRDKVNTVLCKLHYF